MSQNTKGLGGEKVSEKKASTDSPKFKLNELRKNCLKLFNVSASTFDGATFGLKGEFTVEEIKDKIKKWNDKEVIK